MIRQATREDIGAITALAHDMHAASNYASVDFDASRVAQFIAWLQALPGGYVAVSCTEGEPNGFLFALAGAVWFGNGRDLIAEELVLYVAPEARGGRAALGLVQALKSWAHKIGAKQVRSGTSAGAAGQGAGRLYEHVGFARTGECFLLDIAAQAQPAAA